MTTPIAFTKMHGLGNDYLLVDATRAAIADPPAAARAMSGRHTGVGADGLILVLPPDAGVEADLRMRIYNADGSEAEMCGNGIRCLCKFACERGLTDARPLRVQTGAGVLALEYERDDDGAITRVTVDMGPPGLEPGRVPVAIQGVARVVDEPVADHLPILPDAPWARACGLADRFTCVSMGNPHLVLFCLDVEAVPLEKLGPLLGHHALFPNRTNVQMVEVRGPGELVIRTWERGSGCTLACGTGAAAVCVAAALTGRADRRVTARLPGGELDVRWDEATDHVFIRGPAVELFDGVWPDS
ncbi:MAG: diaminopimelate epimerase [Planctomycetota bacterium]|jgi:diaminopimelate epimerase